jgi:hypothetical protein
MKFRKKPVVIEAVQWTGDNWDDVSWFLIDAQAGYTFDRGPGQAPGEAALSVNTLEGPMRVSLNDWVIRGVQGECYPCKPDIFAATYDPVEEAAA